MSHSYSHSHSPDHSASAASTMNCGDNDDGEVVQSDAADAWIYDRQPPSSFFSFSSPPSSDATYIDRLFDSEPHLMPCSDYLDRCRDRSIDVPSRQDSINWILKVHAYYRFSPVTALLSVNYFDRFLSSNALPANRWPFQLLSAACLSLAAKMEEPHVPLLLDLQILEPGFVFEPKTIQRMELWVMANLHWRLRSVTPFDYLHYFISNLPSCSSSEPDKFNRIFSASSGLILSTTRVIDFLGFPPSTIAAAAILCASDESSYKPATDGHGPLFHERVNKEMVRSCHQLMEEYLVDTCPSAKDTVAQPSTAPPSPVGVLDAAACGSCDTRSEIPGSSSQPDAEPLVKRQRSSTPDVQQP